MDSARFISRRPLLIGVAAFAAAALVVVLGWFQPQKLFIDTKVNEALPGVENDEAGGKTESTSLGSTASQRKVLARGGFRALAHPVLGKALLLEVGDGTTYLRFEDFSVENGPDLRVYLSASATDPEDLAFDGEFIDLGALKGNVGNQNYKIPDAARLEKFSNAVIWCRRFSVGFAVAALSD